MNYIEAGFTPPPRIPVCSMYGTYLPTFDPNFMVNVGKYSSPMEHLGLLGGGSPRGLEIKFVKKNVVTCH